MNKRRIFISLLCLTALICFIVGKLFWIQAIETTDYSGHNVNLLKASVIQRQQGIVLDSGRGQFYDRHLTPLTGRTLNALAVFPVRDNLQMNNSGIERIASILQVPIAEWSQFIGHLSQPKLWAKTGDDTPVALTDEQVRRIKQLHMAGLQIVPYNVRYGPSFAARHLLGFISEDPQRVMQIHKEQLVRGKMSLATQIGAAGLEKTFEQYLQSVGSTSISFFTDGQNMPLQGLNVRFVTPSNPFYPLKIVTTLDRSIQQKIERVLDEMKIRDGAVVVLDANHADIVAMASRPNYNPYRVDPQDANWGNKALKAVAPGSIFKTIVAAAALEENKVRMDEMFECSGQLGKYGFSCWKKGGHGRLTFEEAYAESCNITFAKVMERLTPEQLESAAKKLGLTQQVGWSSLPSGDRPLFHQLDGEEKGQVFAAATDSHDDGVKVQTAIGQRDVLVTPLQAANMVVALLNDGEVKAPRAVTSVNFQNGRPLLTYNEQTIVERGEGLSGKTCEEILLSMRKVVTEGTGKLLQNARWELAGKSGTAQVKNGSTPTENRWFIGYGPVQQPRYAVSVVIENAKANEPNESAELFRRVMDILAD